MTIEWHSVSRELPDWRPTARVVYWFLAQEDLDRNISPRG